MYRFFSFRLYPSPSQQRGLAAAAEVCRVMYNEMLAQRVAAYRAGQPVGLIEQLRQVAVYRREHPEAQGVHSHCLQTEVRRAFDAARAWRKAGCKGHGPRPRAAGDQRSLSFREWNNGCRFKGRKLNLFQIGRISIRLHRQIEGTIKSLTISQRFDKWFATFTTEYDPVAASGTGREVALDLGVEEFVLSTGERIPNPPWLKAAREETAPIWERVARAAEGGAGHARAMTKLAKAQYEIAARRRAYFHQVAARLVREYDRIGVEDLNLSELAAHRKSVEYAALGLFLRVLAAKAEATGKVVTFVDPAWSSTTCAECSNRNKSCLPLCQREFSCERCLHRCDRDWNSARVLLARAREVWGTK